MGKRVAVMHSFTGFGHTSMTTAIGVFSVLGIECCPLPTVLLSAHSGIPGFTFKDLSDTLVETAKHWRSLGLAFDAVLSGFMSSSEQMSLALEALDRIVTDQTLLMVDPVMGDNGKLYRTYTEEMCEKMKVFVSRAGIVTPNATEAALLLDKGVSAQPSSEEEAAVWLEELCAIGPKTTIITGMKVIKGQITVGVKSRGDEPFFVKQTEIDAYFPGTGDLFASVLLARLVGGHGAREAVEDAAEFVGKAIEHTKRAGSNPLYGVELEPLLRELIRD